MKRTWKVDKTAAIGTTNVWKGLPSKLPAPWIIVDFKDYFGQHVTLAPGYHMIKKLSNLEYLEYLYESTRRDTH